MSIRVTCPGCHSRFNVSEKFAGKKGPCPKCKKTIEIPAEEVKIEAPESFGPKDSAGRGVLKPVFRKEASISPVQIVAIVASVLLFFVIALIFRVMVEDKVNFPSIVLFVFSAIVALPLAFGGYTFLRDSELAPFSGQDLWVRLLICAVVYVLLWFAMPIAYYTWGSEWGVTAWASAFVVMIGIGGVTAMGALNLDFIMGALHYGLYLVACVTGRLLAGFGAAPGVIENDLLDDAAETGEPITQLFIQSALELVANFNF